MYPISILESFDPHSEAVLNPWDLAPPVEGFPETVIMTFKPQSLDALRAFCPTEIISHLGAGIRIPIYRFSYRDRTLGACLTLVGGAGSAALLEEVLAKGAKRVLFYGSCGALDRSLTAGRLILPTAACRDEGTSYHYLPPGADYVEVPTAGRLGEIFDELNLPYVTGRTWTTDALYRETRNNIKKRRAEGCIAVDMECASVMAAAQFRGASVYQFLYAEDSLDGAAWDRRTLGRVPSSEYERYLRIALEVAARL